MVEIDMQDTRTEVETGKPFAQAQALLNAAQPQRRWEVTWAATMVIYNALLDSPLSALVGAVARGLGEILTTGAMCFALLIVASSRVHRMRYIGLIWPLVVFSAYVVIQSVVLRVHPFVALYGLRAIVRLPLVILFVALATNTDRDRRWLLQVVLCVGLVESAVLIAQYLAPDLSLWDRLHPTEEFDSAIGRLSFTEAPYPSGTFPRFNFAAEFLVSVALMAIGGMTVVGKRTTGVVSNCIVVVVGVFVTLSRTAQLILFLGGAFMFARRKLFIPLAVVLGALLSLAVVYGRGVDYGATASGDSTNIAERFLSLFSESYWEVQTGDEELQRWPAAIDGTQNTLAKYPLLGTGIGTIGSGFTDSGIDKNDGAPYPTYNRLPWLENKISLRAMSDVGWVCLLAQLGIVGLAVLGWVYWSFFRATRFPRSASSYLERVATAICVAFVVFNSTISAFLSRSFLSSAAVIIGVIISASRSRHEQYPSE